MIEFLKFSRAWKDQWERSLQTQKQVEQVLLGPYPASRINPDAQCDNGHVFHGLVTLCKQLVPFPWTKHVAVMEVDEKSATSNMVSLLQENVTVILGVVFSHSHWALAVFHAKVDQVVLFDGKQNELIAQKTEKWAKSFSDPKKLTMACVPKQEDSYSCGHRIILAANYILRHLFPEDGGSRRSLVCTLPDDFACSENMKALAHLILQAEVQANSSPVKREGQPQPIDQPAKRVKMEQPQLQPYKIEESPDASKSKKRGFDDQVKIEQPQLQPGKIEENPDASKSMPASSEGGAEKPDDVAEQPSTPKRKRRSCVDDDTPTGAKPKAKKKLSSAEVQAKIEAVSTLLLERNLDHNKIFQKKHSHLIPKRGHWKMFVKCLALGEPLTCEVCQELANTYYHSKPDDVKVDDAEEGPRADADADAEQPVEKQFRKRGRPCRGEKTEPFLIWWIPAHRSGVYKPEPDSSTSFSYYCIPCNKKVNFCRDAVTYVHLHEKSSKSHQSELQTLGLNVEGKRVSEGGGCTGVNVHLSKGTSLHKLTTSLEMWWQAGQPMVGSYGSRKGILEFVTWRLTDDQLIVRSVNCKSPWVARSFGCRDCRELLDNVKLCREIAQWGYRLDLAQMAYLAAYGTQEEAQRHEKVMKARDYVTLDWDGFDMEEVFAMTPAKLIWHVRKNMESVPKQVRNASYESLIQLRLAGLAEFTGDVQKNVFASIVQRFQSSLLSGQVLEDDPCLFFVRFFWGDKVPVHLSAYIF